MEQRVLVEGILNDVGSNLSVTNSTIAFNSAVRAGGGIEDNSGTSTILLTNVNLDNNDVVGPPGNGGGLHITGSGSATILGGTVNGNSASQEGGGLWNGSGTMTVNNTEIDGNLALGSAAQDGGAAILNVSGIVNISFAEINNNMSTGTSASGGAILSLDGEVNISQSSFEANAANRAGGAIEIVNGDLMIASTDFTANDVNGTAGTPAPGNGGAIHITGMASVDISNSNFIANLAGREGGALWNQTGSTMDLEYVTIDANVANGDDDEFGGGGIFNNGGDLTLSNSTVSNNLSTGLTANGGGIHVKAGAVMVMTSTISGNSSASNGGGIYNNADLDVNASTIAFNTATAEGGGIANMSATAASIKNTIVASNLGLSADVYASTMAIASNGYNLIGIADMANFTSMSTDLTGSANASLSANLAPLSLNGGITMTHALSVGSEAYNAGDPADMFNDQNDNMVFDGRRDIGATEAQMNLVSTDEFSNQEYSVYPNPSSNGIVNIKLTDVYEPVQARVIELATGKVVQNFTITNVQTELRLKDVSAGLYMLELKSENSTIQEKLVIQ